MKKSVSTTLISASAGSGKTYQLAGRFLRVLLEPESGGGRVDPTTVLATTFTRAAAGEILSRVLGWLARAVFDPEKRKQLGEISGSGKEPTVAECAEVLEAMTERMHRLQIGTMDGIFAKVARSFGPSVGLPPVWTIALPEQAARLAESAVDELLAGWEGAEVRKAWRKFKGKAPALGLRAQLMETFEEMRLDLRGLQSDGSWATDTGPKRMEAAACTKLRDAVKTFTAPKRGHWVKSLEKLALLLASPPRLVDLLEIGPVRKLALNEGKYDGVDIPANFAKEFLPWAHKARGEMVRIHQLRESALVALATKYDRARGAQSYSSGSYTFREVEAAALQVAGGLDSEELYFRLDGRIAHLLLDEFQDTSRRQFSFFKPVLEETTGKGGHVLVVGDRKQSIYGWRGSDPRLLRDVEKVLPGVKRELLSESFRSSRAVLAAVDRAFVGLPESELFHQKGKEKPVFAAAAAEWREDYQSHKSSPQAASQSGKVVLYVTPGSCSDEVKAAVRKQVVQLAKAHVENQKGSLGILCRTHKLIPGILAGLKSHGIEASGEGGNPLTDSAAVEMILSLLSWADHPGHSAARYHVCAGGMAEVFGCGKVPAKISGEDPEARDLLKKLRTEITDRGLAEVVSGWVASKEWREAGTAHDRMRCSQLVESARAFDEGGGGRLAEFVRRVRAERVENPRAAQVRVMTVHGAKGLEFDRVILADLDRGLSAGGMDKVKVRVLEEENRAVILPSEEDAGFLGMGELVDKVKGEEFMEALSVLYVGLTRAKRDLEVVVGGPRKGENLNLGKILRSQWGWLEAQAEGELEVFDSNAEKFSGPKKAVVPADPGVAEKVGTAPRRPEARLELESPSAREGGGKVRLSHVIAQSSGRALDRGTRIHAWLSKVEWQEGKGPEAKRWVEEAPELWWGMEEKEVRQEAEEVVGQMQKGMDWVFGKKDWEKRWSGVAKLEVWRERSFAVVWEREGEREVLTGTFDRVVVGRDGKGKVVGAEVVDFKTDRLDGEKDRTERAEYYRPQLEAYAEAVSKLTGLSREKVTTRIAWVWGGP
jgi:ATP-dependent exoDNAse (exonuclease V) beta subunit